MYLIQRQHGGDCCGRRHISGFGYSGPQKVEVDFLKKALGSFGPEFAHLRRYGDDPGYDKYKYGNFGVEITLTTAQKVISAKKFATKPSNLSEMGDTWEEILPQLGFVEVYEFTNPNTNNRIHVYFSKSVFNGGKIPEQGEVAKAIGEDDLTTAPVMAQPVEVETLEL